MRCINVRPDAAYLLTTRHPSQSVLYTIVFQILSHRHHARNTFTIIIMPLTVQFDPTRMYAADPAKRTRIENEVKNSSNVPANATLAIVR
jgi:hypothetical protein